MSKIKMIPIHWIHPWRKKPMSIIFSLRPFLFSVRVPIVLSFFQLAALLKCDILAFVKRLFQIFNEFSRPKKYQYLERRAYPKNGDPTQVLIKMCTFTKIFVCSYVRCKQKNVKMPCFTQAQYKLAKLCIIFDEAFILDVSIETITQTCPCNIMNYFTAVNQRLMTTQSIISLCCKLNGYFQMKKCHIFLIFDKNIDHGYTLEPPQWGGSNEYPNLCFRAKIR